VLGACLNGAVPTTRFSDYEARAADGSTFVTTGLDVADSGDTPSVFLLDVGVTCANVINTPVLKLHGLKLLRPQAAHR
jgi:hypothetical protein